MTQWPLASRVGSSSAYRILVENKSWAEDPVVAAVVVEQEAAVVLAEQWH